MPKTIIFIFVLLFCFLKINTNAQFIEDFNDGNFSANPTWAGDSSSWIINPSGQLQSNDTIANSIFYLSTANTLANSAQWEFDVQLAFNTSSANYVDAFLTASYSVLTDINTTGYFIRIGNTNDEISLYRKDAGGTITKIIDGINGVLNRGNNVVKVKVVCTAANDWTLFRDLTGTGTNYISEGTTTDLTYTNSAYLGFVVKQSTASFFKKHFFDNIQVKPYTPDITPPGIQSVNAVTNNSINVLFTEAVDETTAQTLTNYLVSNGIGNPATAVRDEANNALVHLTFTSDFPSGTTLTLIINNIGDIAGNTLINSTTTFSFYTPHAFDVVIDEILADPTPVVGLPDAEFIELKNTSGKDINLSGWKLTVNNTVSGSFPSYTLPADSFLIITGSSNADLFLIYGKVIEISSFPTLNNSGTTLSLVSNNGVTIHSVTYENSWFQNDVKGDGGWTLEMIDTHNPCSGANNWKASTDVRGGTPAAKNSVDGDNPDDIAPALLRAAALDSVTIVLTFSEPVDSTTAANAANYNISEGITLVAASAIPPAFNKVQLALGTPIVQDRVYTVTANSITDCSGNIIQAVKTARVGLKSIIDSNNIVINEILFNPKPGAVDYVEVYNRSTKIIDLKDLYLANRSSTTNVVGSTTPLTTDNILLFPGDFFVISENGSIVKQNYAAKNPDNFIDVAMPSFPDVEGTVLLLNRQANIVDELHYSSKWHFALIDNEEGISLERIDYNKPTQNKENWTSAASTAGFGTPSYQNSQFRTDVSVRADITVTPKTFSPDRDGFEDFTTINYQMTEPGFVANITVFDATGRSVKRLANNATLALSGSFRWDGLDDKFSKVPVGAYVIFTEVFNLNGKKKSFKNAVIVAARF